MSKQTQEALAAALQEHIADETGGDLVIAHVITCGIVDQAIGYKTTYVSMSEGLARYEWRGLLGDGLRVLDQIDASFIRKRGDDDDPA